MSTRGVARAAGIMMGGILASRVLGFIRERAVAEVFGRTQETDAFFAAFGIPDLMYYLLVGGALSAAFIPVFTSYLARDETEEAWRVASTFINVIVLLLVILTLLGVVFAPFLAPLVAYGFEGDQLDLLILLMRIMFPAVFFTALAGVAIGVLNSYQYFLTGALGPIFYNVSIIAAAYILGPWKGVLGMAYGVVLGAAGNLLIQLPALWRRNEGYKLIVDYRHPGIRHMTALMVPALIGLSVMQLNLISSQNLASGLSEGSITALRLANRLMQFPLGVFAMGISTAVYPAMTRQVATRQMAEFRRMLSLSLRSVLLVTIPSAVGLFALREPIVRLLFEYGEFGPDDTRATAYALAFYSLGLVSQSGIQIVTRVYYSLHDTVTPVKAGVLTVIVNTLLSILLLNFTSLSHGGLALAFSITSLFNFGVILVILRGKLGGIDGRRISVTVIKTSIASAAMGIAAWEVVGRMAMRLDLAASTWRLVQVGAGVAAGIVVFGIAVVLLKMEELGYFWDLFTRRLGRSREY